MVVNNAYRSLTVNIRSSGKSKTFTISKGCRLHGPDPCAYLNDVLKRLSTMKSPKSRSFPAHLSRYNATLPTMAHPVNHFK